VPLSASPRAGTGLHRLRLPRLGKRSEAIPWMDIPSRDWALIVLMQPSLSST
jgi:hypothetical protein